MSTLEISQQPVSPKPINLSGGRMVRFLETKLDAWLEAQATTCHIAPEGR